MRKHLRRVGHGDVSAVRATLVAIALGAVVAGCAPAAPSVPTSPLTSAPSPAVAPTTQAAPSPSATSSPSATAASASAALDGVLDRMQAALGAGISVAVISSTGTWTGAAGVRDPATGAAVTPATVFAIGSITKTATSALVLRLAEQGRVDLDAPISRYLPGDLGVDLNGATVRQVLGDRSGIGEHTLDPLGNAVMRDPLRRWEPREVLAYAEGPRSAAGSEFRYTNTNYVLLGLLVEQVTGRPFGDVLRQEILDPLRLPAFVYQPDEAPRGELAVGLTYPSYPDMTGALRPISGGGLVPALAWATAAGSAGGIGADAVSVAQWGRALFDGQVLSAASLAAMLDFDHPDGVPYGLGVMQVEPEKGQKVVGHNGGIPGFSSALLHDRDRDVTVAVLVARDLAQGQDPIVLAEMFLQAASAPRG